MATYTSVISIAVLYGLSSWAVAVAAGTDQVAGLAQKEQVGLVFGLAAQTLGGFFADLGNVLFLTSLLAAMISFHNTIARYIFALGRERVLPAVFGSTSPSGVPRVGSATQSTVALVVMVLAIVFNLDPFVHLFFALAATGGLGVLVLLVLTSASVLAFFRRQEHRESAWSAKVAPLFALIAVTAMLVLVLAKFDMLLGLPPGHVLRWGVPVAYLVAIGLGSGYGLWLRSVRQSVYHSIGMGAKSTTTSIITKSFPVAGEGPASAFGAGQ
jgi:amino acid transporter